MINNGDSLEQRIRVAYDSLSSSHRRLAEYLLENGDTAAFATARQLAQILGISESTVVRLAPELGYEGFPALQAEFQQQLLSRVEWRPPLRRAVESLPRDATAIMHQILQNDIDLIRRTMETVTAESFEQAIAAVQQARNIYVLGLRTSAAHAIYTVMRLRHVRHRTYFLSSQFSDLADQMLAIEPGDLIIAISYFRYTADTVRALRYARKRGIKTLLITDDLVSPPARAAEIVLIAHGPSSKLFHSLAAPLSLLNALVAAVAVLDKENSDQNIVDAYKVIDQEFEVLLEPLRSYELKRDDA